MNLKLLLRTALIPSLAAGTAFAQSAAAPPPTQVPVSALSVGDPGLEVTVWAQSPQIHNPTNLDFDKDGRIWVAEGVNYRSHYNRQPEGDRIVVLEDTDGDGRADKEGIFVQEPDLRAPMGLAVLDNRVIVSMAPNIILYTDVNRDRRFFESPDRNGPLTRRDLRQRQFEEAPWVILELSGTF